MPVVYIHSPAYGFEQLPANPFYRPPSARDPLPEPPSKEDFDHYCDSCQRGFHSAQALKVHMADHIWCDIPGCKFTCRTDKAWKMEMHKQSLHDRPDAPDLTDTVTYLKNRKSKFPTNSKVLAKVEELQYRAARGGVVDSDQRRWLRTFGVRLRRTGPPDDRRRRDDNNPHNGPQNNMPLRGRAKIVDMVTKMKERYQKMKRAPSYYVCHRCGEKGDHWSHECPTQGDKTFDKKYVPAFGAKEGEGVNPKKRSRSRTDSHSSDHSDTTSSSSDDDSSDGEGGPENQKGDVNKKTGDAVIDVVADDGFAVPPPPSHDHQRTKSFPTATTTAGNIPPPLLAQPPPRAGSVPATATNTAGLPTGFVRRRRGPPRPPPRPPTLFERLTEKERIDEKGLVLQAIRYIVSTAFLSEANVHLFGESDDDDDYGDDDLVMEDTSMEQPQS
eukprot:PhF_6_TR8772/c0_g1_i1/m.13885